jgi:acetaldehyde dehydrogenase (acetylating)
MHLLNVKRLAFETAPLNTSQGEPLTASQPAPARRSAARTPVAAGGKSWMDEIEARLRDRAGNPAPARPSRDGGSAEPSKPTSSVLPMPDAQIDRLVQQFKK